jgi:hypothetical protein
VAGQARRVPEGSPEQELDLPVHAAQLIVGPALDRVEDVPVDAKQEGFAFGHVRIPARGRARLVHGRASQPPEPAATYW